MSARPLTSKEATFCERIVAGDRGVTAAVTAGYPARTAAVMASKLLAKGKIKERITALKKLARDLGTRDEGDGAPPPDVSKIIVDRAYLVRRLVEIQHNHRDGVALNAIKMLGQEEFSMFFDRVAIADPATSSTDDLTKQRDKIRRKHGLAV